MGHTAPRTESLRTRVTSSATSREISAGGRTLSLLPSWPPVRLLGCTYSYCSTARCYSRCWRAPRRVFIALHSCRSTPSRPRTQMYPIVPVRHPLRLRLQDRLHLASALAANHQTGHSTGESQCVRLEAAIHTIRPKVK